jgi:hypothetical protein
VAVRAVGFDIGGVLEITPYLGMATRWEEQLGLEPGELERRTHAVWAAGEVGAISEAEVHRQVGELLGLDDLQVHAFMSDLWTEYLGTLNVELAEYCPGLRPRYRRSEARTRLASSRCASSWPGPGRSPCRCHRCHR